MSFSDLGLAPALVSALTDAGFSEPTPVQARAIPLALEGHDLMVSSQTGSGKTAAFMLPALHKQVQASPLRTPGVRVLVLTPTRELAQQVTDATRTYGKALNWLRTATVVGGMPYGAQLKALSRRVDVLVATPGRLLDHVQSRKVDLSEVEVLVLDEADRMLDMGFIDDIEAIVARTPQSRQTLLFSATLDGSVARMAAKMMRDPQRIEIASQKEKHVNITQSLLYADDMGHKMRLLDHLLRDVNIQQAIVFTSTKRAADDLADTLADQGFAAAALHGDMNQRQRTRTLGQMQRGQVQILVATDVAARGIDVQGISHVVNFDLPMQAEDYVHRIGRTGRAGRDGLAFTLAVHGERHKIRNIERYTDQSIPVQVVPGLEPQRAPRPGADRPRRGGPGSKPGWRPGGRGGYQSRDSGNRPEGRGRFERDPDSRPVFGDRPRGERQYGDRTQGERSYQDRAPRERAYGAGDRSDRARTDRPYAERPWGDRPRAAQGDAERRERPTQAWNERPRTGRAEGERRDAPVRRFDSRRRAA
ncbi:RNA helicase [Pigmentiphaga sp. NML080357]|uniref:DEAD/DEAH box helicase n=1 Tax=Pigmentiphaga sp. NML080357 TaxID=2008675 RepID=UPI000B417B87|nr:DEAD/DEAH box helicase [Pigmentiphaga sp. NML080357]OVZ58765.1 RNA helicase [Pigmentiphaga sp. NML080357]